MLKNLTEMDHFQFCLKAIFAGILTYLSPIDGPLTALVVMLSLNMFVGIGVGVGWEGEHFQFKKAFWALIESAVIAVLIASIYFFSEKQGDLEAGIRVTSYAVYVALVLYGQNVVKNLRKVWPDNKFLMVLNYFLSAEFLRILGKIKERRENRCEQQDSDQDNNYQYHRNRGYYEEQ